MNPKPQDFKPVYFLQRPPNPVNNNQKVRYNKNLSLTMGANQTINSFLPMQRAVAMVNQKFMTDSPPTNQEDRLDRFELQMKRIQKQNTLLKGQNEQLRRELMTIKKETLPERFLSADKYSVSIGSDVRGTIKKEGEMKQMRLKLEMLSKQCERYEEVIDKMEEEIKKLTHVNSKRLMQLDELQREVGRVEEVRQKVMEVMRRYNEMESKFNSDQLEWMKWKQNWSAEKEYYVQRIRELERLRK